MKRPNVLNLTCPAIPVVRIGFVGLGNRGILALERYMHLEGIEVKALCDLRKENIERAEHILREFGRPEAENYSEEGMWRKMCECKEIDLIYICTDWLTHTDIAVYALQQGRHVALEVPAAMSVADCWGGAVGGYSRRNPPSLHDAGELLLRCICPDYIEHGAAGGVGRNHSCRGGIHP